LTQLEVERKKYLKYMLIKGFRILVKRGARHEKRQCWSLTSTGKKIPYANHFCYLGSTIHHDGELEEDVKNQSMSEWMDRYL